MTDESVINLLKAIIIGLRLSITYILENLIKLQNSTMLYQLGKYNTKEDLSIQSKRIRDHIQKNWDFKSIHEIIKTYDNLEFETVLILKKAINAGYWDSWYGLHWNSENELEFWTTVYNKSKELAISKLQFLRTLQSTGTKNLEELIDEYIDLLKSCPGLYYELIAEDLERIWRKNEKVKISCLNAMFIHLANDMDLNEFSKEVILQMEFHYKNGIIPQEIKEVMNRIKITKSR